MVNSKRYDPTITRFRKHTQGFVSGKTKKGHLQNEENDKGDVFKDEGELIKIIKKKKDDDGWVVKVSGKTYNCTYGDNIRYMPDCTDTGEYLVPKKKCKVEVSIDKKSKIYTITRIIDKSKTTISASSTDINLNSGGKASVNIGQDKTNVSQDLSVNGDITFNTDDEEEISMADMYGRIKNLELKLSDDDDDMGTE